MKIAILNEKNQRVEVINVDNNVSREQVPALWHNNKNDSAMSEDYKKLISELNKQGLTLIPINRDSLSIKDEPKWEVVKLSK